MKVVILGAGRRGISLARRLVEEGKEVIILDEKPAAIEKAMQSVDCLGHICTATDADNLREAGIEEAGAFIALTGSDETNLVSCGIVSSKFRIPITIASVSNLSYTKTESLLGITHIVNPYQEVASHIYREIDQGVFSDIISFENLQLVLYNITVDAKSKFAGKLLKNTRNIINRPFIIAALSRDKKAIVPNGDTKILPGDIISAVTQQEDLENLLSIVGRQSQKPKKIALVGGTPVTGFLLREFSEKERKNITVFAKDSNFCRELSEEYPNTLIINANIASEGLFKQESLDSYDLFVGITDNDELNVISASYAKNIGIRNSMALLSKTPDYITMAKHLGIDSFISSQDVTSQSIVQYLHGANISNIHIIHDGQLLAFEYKVTQDSKLCNCTLKDINLKGHGIIAGICKSDGQTIIPTGLYRIMQDDILMFVIERLSSSFINALIGDSETQCI